MIPLDRFAAMLLEMQSGAGLAVSDAELVGRLDARFGARSKSKK